MSDQIQKGRQVTFMETALLLDAISYATRMHGDQKRKYTNEPYMVHTLEVARIIATRDNVDMAMICAAVLHDTVEDTAAKDCDIVERFGPDIANLVGWLTDISNPEDGNRAYRKQRDREHIAMAPPRAKTIKLADLISNSRTIVEYDPGFARVYIEEKALLLDVLTDGDAGLHQQATAIVKHARSVLSQ